MANILDQLEEELRKPRPRRGSKMKVSGKQVIRLGKIIRAAGKPKSRRQTVP